METKLKSEVLSRFSLADLNFIGISTLPIVSFSLKGSSRKIILFFVTLFPMIMILPITLISLGFAVSDDSGAETFLVFKLKK
jgi:hypothetical protein